MQEAGCTVGWQPGLSVIICTLTYCLQWPELHQYKKWSNHSLQTLDTVKWTTASTLPWLLCLWSWVIIWPIVLYTYSDIEFFSNCFCKQDNYLVHLSLMYPKSMKLQGNITWSSQISLLYLYLAQSVCNWLQPNLCLAKAYSLENDLILMGLSEERVSPVLSQLRMLFKICVCLT